jgi:hypothetical protein
MTMRLWEANGIFEFKWLRAESKQQVQHLIHYVTPYNEKPFFILEGRLQQISMQSIKGLTLDAKSTEELNYQWNSYNGTF